MHDFVYHHKGSVSELRQQRCAQNNTQTLIVANTVYTGLSFVSFLISLTTLMLTISQFYKKNTSTERSELIFVLISFVLTLLTFIESFQWVFLLSGKGAGLIACQILGAFREHGIVMLFVLVGCIGFHLVLLQQKPKFLMVIDEVKKRRYRNLVISYTLVTLIVPIVFLPWPLVVPSVKLYGPSAYICWISQYDENCSYLTAGLIEQAALFYVWTVIMTFMTILIVCAVSVTVCRQVPRRYTTNYCTLLPITACLFIVVLIMDSLFIAVWVIEWKRVQLSLSWLIYVQVTLPPLFNFYSIIVFFVRICYTKYHRRPRSVGMPVYVRKEESNVQHPNETTPLISTATSTGTSAV